MNITAHMLPVNATCAGTTLRNIENFQSKDNRLAVSLAIVQLFIEKVVDTAIHLLAVVPTVAFTAVQIFLYPLFGGTSPISGAKDAFAHVAYAVKSLAAATVMTPLALLKPTLISTSYQWLSLYPHKASTTSRINSALTKAWLFAQTKPALVIGGGLATVSLLGGIAVLSRRIAPMPEKIGDDALNQGKPNPTPSPNKAAQTKQPLVPPDVAQQRLTTTEPGKNSHAPSTPLQFQPPLNQSQIGEPSVFPNSKYGCPLLSPPPYSNNKTTGNGTTENQRITLTSLCSSSRQGTSWTTPPHKDPLSWNQSPPGEEDSISDFNKWAGLGIQKTRKTIAGFQVLWQAIPSRESLGKLVTNFVPDAIVIGAISGLWMVGVQMLTNKASSLEKLVNTLGSLFITTLGSLFTRRKPRK